jgi:hypothetical protein
MTYVAEFFHAFSSLGVSVYQFRDWQRRTDAMSLDAGSDKQETTARRVTQFAEMLKALQ